MAKATTAAWLGGLSGRLQNVYFAETPYGTQLRVLPERRAAPTEGEMAQRRRIAAVGRLWNALDREAMLAWKAYGEGLGAGPVTGRTLGVAGYNAFSRLASKRLQLWPQEPVPSLPPTAPFFGDAMALSVEGGGGVVFTADQPNATGVVTELLLQPLRSGGRTPRPKAYASASFVAFAEGELAATLAVAPGWYACAYRFVREATGQETALAPCGVVRVHP